MATLVLGIAVVLLAVIFGVLAWEYLRPVPQKPHDAKWAQPDMLMANGMIWQRMNGEWVVIADRRIR